MSIYPANEKGKCPQCGHGASLATSVMEDTSPKPGDYAVCIECAGVNRYQKDLSLREATFEEIHALSESEQDVLLRVIERILTARSKKN